MTLHKPLSALIFALLLASAFALPAGAKSADRQYEFEAVAGEAAARFGVSDVAIELRIVSRHHAMLGGVLHARAALYDSGPRVIFVSESLLIKPERFQSEVMQHEYSHHAGWIEHGTDILEHGNVWRKGCLTRASRKTVCSTVR